jgi:hypothetical protein
MQVLTAEIPFDSIHLAANKIHHMLWLVSVIETVEVSFQDSPENLSY